MPFEAIAYENQTEQIGLQEILDALGDIDAKFVSREEFQNLGDDIISREGNQGDYTLTLPEDVRVEELPRIMRHVNEMTFGTDFPIFSSSRELQYKIVIILEELEEKIGDGPEFLEAIEAYSKFYADITSPEEASQLQDNEYREQIITQAKDDEFQVFQGRVRESILNNTREQLSDLRDELDTILAGEIEDHFEEAFMERGVDSLRQGLMTFTQLDVQRVNEYKLGEGESINNSRVEQETLDKEERRLRNAIQIDEWKGKIEKARNSGSPNEVEALELKFCQILDKELKKYAYQYIDENFGYQPSKILESKQIYCTGFTFIAHSFLSEVGIKHSSGVIEKHIFAVAHIGEKDYIIDGAVNSTIFEIVNSGASYERNDGLRTIEKPGDYHEGNIEDFLMSAALGNKGKSLYEQGRINEALDMVWQSIEASPLNTDSLDNIAIIFKRLGKNKSSLLFSYTSYILRGKPDKDWKMIYPHLEGTPEVKRMQESILSSNLNGFINILRGIKNSGD